LKIFSEIGRAADRPAKALFSRDADATERYRRTVGSQCGATHQTSSISKTRPTPSGDVSLAVP